MTINLENEGILLIGDFTVNKGGVCRHLLSQFHLRQLVQTSDNIFVL